MTNKELYKLMKQLGMLEEDDNVCMYPDDGSVRDPAADFEISCKDIVNVVNFVDDLTTFNSLEIIKKFLVCLFSKNTENSNDEEKKIGNGEMKWIDYVSTIPAAMSSDGCKDCWFMNKMESGETYVGDSPCTYCQNSPMKITCNSKIDLQRKW